MLIIFVSKFEFIRERHDIKGKSINVLDILMIMISVIVSFYILHSIFEKSFTSIGYLVVLCFFPLFTILYWTLKTKYIVFYFSLCLVFCVLLLYPCFRYCININNFWLKISSATIYGFICSNSCLLGLKMKKDSYTDEKFQLILRTLILVSVGVAFFLVLLEAIHNGDGMSIAHFMISFDLLILAISFLYVIFGCFSQDSNFNPDPLVFFIFASMSFSIGFMLSIFVVEFGEASGAFPSHWPFICIWTVFTANVCVGISEKQWLHIKGYNILKSFLE